MDPNDDKSDSLSKSKRTFVLGVVDTSGMKSAGSARKRRWDQPPDEGEETDGAAPAKVAIREADAPQAEDVKPVESFEDELQDVFFDTSETILEESPVEEIETVSEPVVPPTSEHHDDSSPMETLLEVSSSISDEPENVTSSTSENDLKLIPETVVEEVKVETNPIEEKKTTPVEEKKTVVKEISLKSINKKETKTVAPVIISDSLKAIQFCYDEDDSNSSEGSDDDEGAVAVIPAVVEDKTVEKAEPSVESSTLEAAEVTVEPCLDTDSPEEEVAVSTRVGTASDIKDKVVIDSIPSQEDVIIEPSPMPAELQAKDKSRSPTPVLADEQDEDSVEQATVLDDTTVGAVQVDEIGTIEEMASVVVDTTMVECESAVITDEPLVQDILQDNPEVYETIQPVDERVIESIAEGAVLDEGVPDAAKGDGDITHKLSVDVNDQPVVEVSGSRGASETGAAVKGLEKADDSLNDKSLMDFLYNPSEQSDASKTMVEPPTGNEQSDQNRTNLISMDNSQNCCVSFDDMSNLDKNSSKSPELDLRYTESEESNDVKHSNPEITMHFASVRTQDSVQTPESAHEEAEELKDESALAIDALLCANPELDEKPLDFEEQSQSQTTMEMLDSLVRRSSEDDPTRLSRGGGLFSDDSLINEINQLPDQESQTQDTQGSSKSTRKDTASIRVDHDVALSVSTKHSEPPRSEDIAAEAKVSEPVADTLVLPKSTAVSAPRQEIEKSETCTSVEEELSQGVDEESKNVTVSSANILEVIFGSEQKSKSHSTNSLEGGAEVKTKKKIKEDASSEAKGVKSSSVSEKPVNDSKLQLKNDDFEMGSAEIVAVDPTISLSGEDSDEDEVPSSKEEKLLETVKATQQAQEPIIVEDDESMQPEEGCESVQSLDVSEDITVQDLPLSEDPKVEVLEIKSVEVEHIKAVHDSPGLQMDVDESSSSTDDKPELPGTGKTQVEPMEVEAVASTPVVGKSSRSADVPKREAASSSVKEPVPVLIIKKQSLPSKKLGESVETLLTCSPKSADVVISSSPRKPTNESLHVDTVQDTAAETSSPKHSPITLRIYKDNLSVKTDLDSPKRNKSPLASEFKSELSPRSGISDNVSPQNKQLEFTLKIAKDASTNQPKATMSPKHVASPTSVWKSEVHVDTVEKQPRSVSAATTEKQPRAVTAEKLLKNASAATPEKSSRPVQGASAGKQPRSVSDASTGKQTSAGALASTEKQPCNIPVGKVEKQPTASSVPAVEKELPIASEPVAEKQLLSALSAPDRKHDEGDVKPAPTRGRGRGRGSTARRTPAGRGRRGGAIGQRGKTDEPAVTPDEDASEVKIKLEAEESSGSSTPSSLGLQMTDAFKKMMSQEKASLPQPELLPPVTPVIAEVVTPVVKKRGRPRKSVQQVLPVPEEMVPIKTEPFEPSTPADVSGSEAGEDTPSGRPKRTCRGRTKPIVVKKKRGGAVGSVVPRGASSTPLPVDPADIKQEGTSSVAIASTTPTVDTGTADTPASDAATSSPEKPVPHTPVPTPTDTVSPVLCHKCGTEMKETIRGRDSDGNPRRVHRCPRGGCQVYRFPHLTYVISEAARGRGNFKRPTPDRNTLSEKELAELQKIEAKKEKLRLDRIAKYEAKKAKKLAKKLKDEERRKRQAQEKAEKAAAAAPQVFEEETRMSAPDSSSRGHTPAPNRVTTGDTMTMGDESQNSTTTPGDSNRGNKKGRMEIAIGDLDCLVKEVKVDDLAEYQWQGSELYMIQEQVSLYLGVKSFKRKYPGLKRRTIEAEERTFLEDSGLVPKSMCDLGITAVSSAEILDIMFQDFPDKYEEFRKHVRDKQAREASYKQKAAIGLQKKDGTKLEPREQALEAVASWNASLNRERREERKCALDLQTFTVHYPKVHREHMAKPTSKVGLYPVAVIPGQFCDFYKNYTPTELMYFPINTVLYGPLKPNERQKDGSEDGSASESSSSSSSSSSSGESSSESESEGEDPPKCTVCNGTKKKNKESLPEVLLSCIQCKACYHPSCKAFTPEMTPHLVKYEWQCTACKKCTKCRDPNLKDQIMGCQLCDRGYHLSCIGLKKMPEGRWHCTVCAYCSSCGSRNPGGSDWQHEFKKGEKGTKVYQRTLCTPCFKLWRKGKYCQLCSKCHAMKPEEDPNLIQCNSCDRWLHKECYGTKYGIQNKLLSTSSIQCDICVERIQNSSISGLNRSLIKV